jgi:hypothetical protein
MEILRKRTSVMSERTDYTASNRAAWDASAPAFEQGAEWRDLLHGAAQPGFSVLDKTITDTLTQIGVRGRRTVQIGCNNGRELLSLPSLGAIPALAWTRARRFWIRRAGWPRLRAWSVISSAPISMICRPVRRAISIWASSPSAC